MGLRRSGHAGMTQPALLDTIEHETAPQPRWTIVWLHGLGADGHDFAAIVPEPVRREWPGKKGVKKQGSE